MSVFKMKISKARHIPMIGTFFSYGDRQYKIIAIDNRFNEDTRLYFAWWDAIDKKILTTDIGSSGMSAGTWSTALANGNYKVITKFHVWSAELRDYEFQFQ